MLYLFKVVKSKSGTHYIFLPTLCTFHIIYPYFKIMSVHLHNNMKVRLLCLWMFHIIKKELQKSELFEMSQSLSLKWSHIVHTNLLLANNTLLRIKICAIRSCATYGSCCKNNACAVVYVSKQEMSHEHTNEQHQWCHIADLRLALLLVKSLQNSTYILPTYMHCADLGNIWKKNCILNISNTFSIKVLFNLNTFLYLWIKMLWLLVKLLGFNILHVSIRISFWKWTIFYLTVPKKSNWWFQTISTFWYFNNKSPCSCINGKIMNSILCLWTTK